MFFLERTQIIRPSFMFMAVCTNKDIKRQDSTAHFRCLPLPQTGSICMLVLFGGVSCIRLLFLSFLLSICSALADIVLFALLNFLPSHLSLFFMLLLLCLLILRSCFDVKLVLWLRSSSSVSQMVFCHHIFNCSCSLGSLLFLCASFHRFHYCCVLLS